MDDEKKEVQMWECARCTVQNNEHLPYCEACHAPKITKVCAWKCKLCSVNNSAHIPYCEICLVPKHVQDDIEMFQELKIKLITSNPYVTADDLKNIIQKLNDDFERLKNYQNDKQIIIELQQQIDAVYAKMGIEPQGNIVQDFIETYNLDQHSFKNQKISNKKCQPICKCGDEMICKKSTNCYGSEFPYVICDVCDQKIPSKARVFHCPKKKIKAIHSSGFDICLNCRKTYIHRLRYFVAVIICPKMSANHTSTDAETLKSTFKKMGFHRIICLKDDEVTKQSVEAAIKSILPESKENVNQFTAICYSGHGDVDENGFYYFALDPYDQNTWVSAEVIKSVCKATQYGAVLDGFKKYFNQFWYKSSYRHNTLLLVNSCRSGASYNFVGAQHIADSFGSFAALSMLLVPFGISLAAFNAVMNKLAVKLQKPVVECIKCWLINNEITWECIAECFAITEAGLLTIAKLAGVAAIVVIIVAVAIYKSIQKSKECESIYVIASCQIAEESNSTYGMSPFYRHCNDFLDIFVNPKKNKKRIVNVDLLKDSPSELFKYVENCYKLKDDALGGMSLNDINQTVCKSRRGFSEFAICPILNRS